MATPLPWMAKPRRRCVRSEAGFTLIEMMVVVLIIAILIAIALPSYVGARERAADQATQADLRTALAVAMTHFADDGAFDGFDVAEAERIEPSMVWMSPGPPAEGQIDIEVAAAESLLLVGLSKTGSYWCLAQVPGSPITSQGGDPVFANVDEVLECTGGW